MLVFLVARLSAFSMMRPKLGEKKLPMRAFVAFVLCLLASGAGTAAAAQGRGATHVPGVVITGANRGIGLEFAKQFAARGWRVHATARDPAAAAALQALLPAHPDLRIGTLDVTDPASVDAFAKSLAGQPIEVIVNNAGVFGDPGRFQLGSIDYGQYDLFFRTNALGPLKVTEALLANVRAGRMKRIVAISPLAGTFAYAQQGPRTSGHYFYRGSKAALNMFIVTLANDLEDDGIIVAALSPDAAPVERSVAGMIDVIVGLTPAESGGYFRWNGDRLDW